MNRTLKEGGSVKRLIQWINRSWTVKQYHYDSHDQLREHLQMFVDADNFAKRLKTLHGLTPFEYVNARWTEQPNQSNSNPAQHSAGRNN